MRSPGNRARRPGCRAVFCTLWDGRTAVRLSLVLVLLAPIVRLMFGSGIVWLGDCLARRLCVTMKPLGGNGVTVLAPRQHAVRAEHGLKLVEDGSAPRGAPTVVHISSAHQLSCPCASHGDAQAAF